MVCLGATIAISGFTFLLLPGVKLVNYLTAAFLGFCIMSIFAVGLDFGCEITFPVPANNATGVMLSYSQIISVIHILFISFTITTPEEGEKVTTRPRKIQALIVCLMLLGTLLLSLFFAVFTKQDLRKTKFDKGQQIESLDGNTESKY